MFFSMNECGSAFKVCTEQTAATKQTDFQLPAKRITFVSHTREQLRKNKPSELRTISNESFLTHAHTSQPDE